jgi:hypothetical protein
VNREEKKEAGKEESRGRRRNWSAAREHRILAAWKLRVVAAVRTEALWGRQLRRPGAFAAVREDLKFGDAINADTKMSLLFHDYTKARTSTTSPGGNSAAPTSSNRRTRAASVGCHTALGASRPPPPGTSLPSLSWSRRGRRRRHAYAMPTSPMCCHLPPSVRTHGHPRHVVAAKSSTFLLTHYHDEAEDAATCSTTGE